MRSHDSIGAYWIVFLTAHKVFDILSVLVDTHTHTQNAVCHCAVADQSYLPALRIIFNRLSILPHFEHLL